MRPRYPTDIHDAYSSLLEVTNFKVWLQTESNFLLRIQLKLVYLGPCCTKKQMPSEMMRLSQAVAEATSGGPSIPSKPEPQLTVILTSGGSSHVSYVIKSEFRTVQDTNT